MYFINARTMNIETMTEFTLFNKDILGMDIDLITFKLELIH